MKQPYWRRSRVDMFTAVDALRLLVLEADDVQNAGLDRLLAELATALKTGHQAESARSTLLEVAAYFNSLAYSETHDRIVRDLQKIIAARVLDVGGLNTNVAIVLPPGLRLRRILEFLVSRKTMERVFEPALADMQSEWLDAIVADRPWKARWVRVRGYYAIAKAAGLQSVVGLVKQAVRLWKAT